MGLKIIDGTPTAISKFIREQDAKINQDFGKYQELVQEWADENKMAFVMPEFMKLFKRIAWETKKEM